MFRTDINFCFISSTQLTQKYHGHAGLYYITCSNSLLVNSREIINKPPLLWVFTSKAFYQTNRLVLCGYLLAYIRLRNIKRTGSERIRSSLMIPVTRPDFFVNTSGCKPFAVENFQRCFPLSRGKFGTLINHVMIDNAIPG